jgi:methionyl-tRNA formyltransferase
MNVVVITEEDVFYIYEFFRTFYPLARGNDYTLRAVTILPAFNKRSYAALARQMYGFYGPAGFVRMGTWYVCRTLTGRTVRTLTRSFGIELVDTRSVNSPAYLQAIRERDTDVIVSIAAPQIFKRDLISSVPRGCINSHSALLPENRGMMPVFWGMYKGDPEIGVTVHYINEGVDTGDIIKQERVAVSGESLHEMILKTKRLSARLIDEALREIARGTVRSTPMPPGGSYQTFPTPAEVKEFRRRGRRML